MNKWFLLLAATSLLNFSAQACCIKFFSKPEPEEIKENSPEPTMCKPLSITIKRSEGTWKSFSREIAENSHQDWVYTIEVNKNNCIRVEDKEVSGVPINLLKDQIRWEHSWNIHSNATGNALLRLTLLSQESKIIKQQLVDVTVID